jgi:hypothetical protein
LPTSSAAHTRDQRPPVTTVSNRCRRLETRTWVNIVSLLQWVQWAANPVRSAPDPPLFSASPSPSFQGAGWLQHAEAFVNAANHGATDRTFSREPRRQAVSRAISRRGDGRPPPSRNPMHQVSQ